jgi:hypothetical protein
MAETIPGGCYKDAEGDGYHDANGNPVSKANVEKFLALQQQQTFGLGALDPAPVDELALLKQQLADLQAQLATQAKPEAPENPDGIDLQRLIDETENRAKKKSK